MQPNKTWKEFDCSKVNDIPPSLATDPATMCHGGGPMWPLGHGAGGWLAVDDIALAPASPQPAVLEFLRPVCSIHDDRCHISLEAVEIGPVRLLQPLLADYDPATGSVRFADGDVFVVVAPDGEAAAIAASEADGTYDGDQLTITLGWTRHGVGSRARVSSLASAERPN